MKKNKFYFNRKKFLNLKKHQKNKKKKLHRVLSNFLRKYKNYKQNWTVLSKQKIILRRNYQLLSLKLLNFKMI